MKAINGMKTCSKCRETKSTVHFSKSKDRVDGLCPQCKSCKKEYREKNRDREVSRSRLWYEENREKQLIKRREEYNKNKDEILLRNKEYYENNKDAVNKKNNEYYIKHKEEIDKYRKQWAEDNKEHLAKYRKQWRIDNKESKSKFDREWRLNNRERINSQRYNKYRTDVQYRLSVILRGRLHDVLAGKIKSGSAVRDLGCGLDGLKKHLESLFAEGMSWNNHGKYGWHIDHIKPLASFDLTDREQLKEACHYTNLQPLWAKDNLSKGAKIEIH